MALFLITLVWLGFSELVLDPEIIEVSYFQKTDRGLLLMDGNSQKLFLCDDQGAILASYGSKGLGPGEFTRIGFFTTHHKEIFVLDYKQHKIVILDQDLKYVDQKFLAAGAPVSGFDTGPKGQFFFYYFSRQKQATIHAYDGALSYKRSFGVPLLHDQYDTHRNMIQNLKSNNGSLVVIGEKLVALPAYKGLLEVYGLDGSVLNVYTIPGQPQDRFDLKSGNYYYMARRLQKDQLGRIYFVYGNRHDLISNPIPYRLYRFDLKNQSWAWASFENHFTWILPDGSLCEAIEPEDETAGITLKTSSIEFKSF